MATPKHDPRKRPRRLHLVLGDQLDHNSATLRDLDPKHDAVWMAETHAEATHVWCHKLRLAVFFSAMRHFRDELRHKGVTVHYHELTTRKSDDRGADFAEVLRKDIRGLKPGKLVAMQPGDFRVDDMLEAAAEGAGIELEVREDDHFFCSLEEFAEWAGGKKELVQEMFYRRMRKRDSVLLTKDGKPVGGEWNYDADNRETFGKAGPPAMRKRPHQFRADALTRKVIAMVEKRFAGHPGSTDHFDLPVTRKEALKYLRDFVEHRLGDFGPYEDAMWTDAPFLYHSRLSQALNMHLLNPRECVEAAIAAYEGGDAPLNSVEGFVRQLIGWREFIRGVYYFKGEAYLDSNALGNDDGADVPGFFWDGDTEMACVRDVMRSVIDHAWAHHIPRLMVMGLFAMLLGVHPRKFHDWHMAMYVDAIDWVSAPNTIGMATWGDGGVVGTKPYAASGNYIDKMSNYCKGCRYHPKRATGDDACPFTTLYWDFLDRHRDAFKGNRRMAFQVKNIDRKRETDEIDAIRKRAARLKERFLVPADEHR
ncbi:MAG: cryptochrome/photolyase family protein [Planctomycetota bacterium]